MTKYEKIISKLKKVQKMSFTGTKAINNFKEKASEKQLAYDLIKETENNIVVSFVVYSSIKYNELISLLVKTKYSVDDEMAILRQRDTKPEEFAEYNSFVEQCKNDAKQFVAERDGH